MNHFNTFEMNSKQILIFLRESVRCKVNDIKAACIGFSEPQNYLPYENKANERTSRLNSAELFYG